MERFPNMKVVMAHGKASWMEEILEKMEASALTFPLLHYYPVSTDPEELWEHGKVMLGFDAQERMVRQLFGDYVEKVVWGSNYPQQDTTSAWEALDLLRGSGIDDDSMARMLGGNAAAQFGIRQVQAVGR
jgi:predicted TIM-barrel fold metal-dependent hydrolase